jgi:hypothetical protein
VTQYSFVARADFDTIASARDYPQAPASRLKRILGLGSVGFLLLLLTGCSSVTVFQSSFDSNAVGAPPSHNQATGTIDVSGAPGSVVIVSAPPNATGNWAQIQRSGGPGTPISTMQCNFSRSPQDGTYSLLAVLYIPSGSGLATVQFNSSAQSSPPSQEIFHLDFGDIPQTALKNTVRIDDITDNQHIFGTFTRNQFFTLAVKLEITPSSANAHMNLYGNASGLKDFNVVDNLHPLFLARQFGEVRFYMGFDWHGNFDATNILVTRK